MTDYQAIFEHDDIMYEVRQRKVSIIEKHGDWKGYLKHLDKGGRRTYAAALILTILLLCGFSLTGAYADDAKPAGSPMTAVNTSAPYHETYSAKPNNAISARSRTGKWAMVNTASGNSIEEILDNKLRFIESVWQEKTEAFVIAEGISASGITDISSLQYMYNQSDIYRDLITAGNTLYIQPDSSFGRLSNQEQDSIYERHAFYLAKPAQLSLSVSYRLDSGRMSVVIVSPAGKILYQNELTSNFDDIISVQLEEGIASVVLVYEMKEHECKGDINISGTKES